MVLKNITVVVNQWNRRRREKKEMQRAGQQQLSDMKYIAAQLICLLEDFASRCADVAGDRGIKEEVMFTGGVATPFTRGIHPVPGLSFDGVNGDWKSLHFRDMYRAMEIPGMLEDARTKIAGASDFRIWEQDREDLLRIRADHICIPGLRAASVARSLRRKCGFPASQLSKGSSGTTAVLRNARKCAVRARIAENQEASS